MRIVTLVPDSALRVIEQALGAGHDLARATGAGAAARTVRGRACDALVLDPGVLRDAEFEELVPALKQKAVPVILFSELTPEAARRIVEVAELGAHELVLRGKDDAVPLLAHRLARLVKPSAPALLLSRAAKNLHRFPDPLQTVAVGLYGSRPLPRWVNGLAEESGLARRSVDRWVERAGIHGAAMLLDTARLARVWEPVVDGGMATAVAAERCGYARVRLLVNHARRIVGVAPADFAAQLTRATFADRLARRLLTR